MAWNFLRRAALPLIAAGAVLVACNGSTTTTAGPPTAIAVLRLNLANGVPDTTFAAGKTIAIADPDVNLFDFALAVAVQPLDNAIVAAGSKGLAGQGVIALARFSANGVLDTTGFGLNGMVITPTPPGWTSAGASAVAVQPVDGKIVVAALLFNATTGNTGIAVLRYASNGTPDTTFGPNANGIAAILPIGPGNATDTCALVLQPADGNIVVAGATRTGNIVLSRYKATDGSVDTTGFGISGIATTTINAAFAAAPPALALQASGQIIVATGFGDLQNGPADQVVLRYTTAGVLDIGFGPAGANGIVITDINASFNYGNAVAVQSDDKIVVAGHSNLSFVLDSSDISLVRYNSDGTLDSTFNPSVTPGIVTASLGGFDNALAVALQSPASASTNIVVAGNTGSGGFSQVAVLRFTTTGALDPAFGINGGGSVILPVFGPSTISSGNAVTFQTNTGIIVAGYD
jgi:uncharacterized delta-60 repeat protein